MSPHRHQSRGLPAFSITPADTARNRSAAGASSTAGDSSFHQFGDLCSIRIRLNMFGNDIHRDFGLIQICADANRRGNAVVFSTS